MIKKESHLDHLAKAHHENGEACHYDWFLNVIKWITVAIAGKIYKVLAGDNF